MINFLSGKIEQMNLLHDFPVVVLHIYSFTEEFHIFFLFRIEFYRNEIFIDIITTSTS